MYEGTTDIILPIILLVLLGAVVLFAAYHARRTGHLKSPAVRIAAIAALVLIAALLWIGPGLFLA